MNRSRPERLLGVLLVLVLAAVVVLVVALGTEPSAEPAATDRPSAPAGATAQVVHVTDGDTIVVLVAGVRERVRYVGVDAPELTNAETGEPAECGGEAARLANAELVEGREVTLERDTSDRDRFGRLLRHVWVAGDDGWTLVSERLVAAGAVEARSYAPDTSRDAQLDTAERRARDANLGIWGSC